MKETAKRVEGSVGYVNSFLEHNTVFKSLPPKLKASKTGKPARHYKTGERFTDSDLFNLANEASEKFNIDVKHVIRVGGWND